MPLTITCALCIYWDLANAEGDPGSRSARCRRKAQVATRPVRYMHYDAHWPVTKETDGCGEGAVDPPL